MIGIKAPADTPAPDVWINDGDSLPILEGKCLHTPGHSLGSTCFYFAREKLLLSGDTLFRNSIGRTDLPGGDMTAITRSIQNILYALPDDTAVIPGHNEFTTIGYEKEHNLVVRAASLPSPL